MGQYTINPDGSKTVYSRYSHKGLCNLNTIFPANTATSKKYLKKKKGFEKSGLQDKYGIHDNSALVRKIFTRFLFKVMTRVSNGELFEMPGITGSNITVKSIPDKQIKKLRQRGFYSDYDIVKADFKIPNFYFDFGPYSARRDCLVYVPSRIMKHTLKLAENRQIPWTYKPKTFDRNVQND